MHKRRYPFLSLVNLRLRSGVWRIGVFAACLLLVRPAAALDHTNAPFKIFQFPADVCVRFAA